VRNGFLIQLIFYVLPQADGFLSSW